MESAFVFAAAEPNGAWKPKVEVGGKGMDVLDLDLELVGKHSSQLGDMVVEWLERRMDHDILEPVVVLVNEKVKW